MDEAFLFWLADKNAGRHVRNEEQSWTSLRHFPYAASSSACFNTLPASKAK